MKKQIFKAKSRLTGMNCYDFTSSDGSRVNGAKLFIETFASSQNAVGIKVEEVNTTLDVYNNILDNVKDYPCDVLIEFSVPSWRGRPVIENVSPYLSDEDEDDEDLDY